MTNEILERFRSLDSSYLLHYAAFEVQDYSLEAQSFLRTVLFERGIDETQIKAYRLKRFPFPTMDVDCDNCGEKLTIERQELNDGTFTCPECNTTQAVPFPEISIEDEEQLLTGRQWSPAVAPGTDTEESTTQELVNDPLANLLGPSFGVSKIGAGDGAEAEEVRLLGEGLPDTTCAKCSRVLDPENTFLAGDDFYCEKCYNELPLSERELSDEDNDEEEEETGTD